MFRKFLRYLFNNDDENILNDIYNINENKFANIYKYPMNIIKVKSISKNLYTYIILIEDIILELKNEKDLSDYSDNETQYINMVDWFTVDKILTDNPVEGITKLKEVMRNFIIMYNPYLISKSTSGNMFKIKRRYYFVYSSIESITKQLDNV